VEIGGGLSGGINTWTKLLKGHEAMIMSSTGDLLNLKCFFR